MSDSKGQRYKSLVIRNVTVVNGRGTPAQGPVDIAIEKDKITGVVSVSPGAASRPGYKRLEGDMEIDAAGMYALPGLVDMHVHVPFRETQSGPKGPEYAYKLFLAHGVTTIRTCGFGTDEKLIEHRRLGKANKMVAPRLVVMGTTGEITTIDEGREAVHKLNKRGTAGIKMIPRSNITAEILAAMGEEVRDLDMKAGIAVHIPQSSELDAVSASEAVPDYLTLEHTYGIPQAAIHGSQSIPPDYNYSDEVDRFRWSGHVWTEADQYPDDVLWVLDTMIENGTVWNPTMTVYEINREYELPSRWRWLDRYTAPGLLESWRPDPARHLPLQLEDGGRGRLEEEVPDLDEVPQGIRGPRGHRHSRHRLQLHVHPLRLLNRPRARAPTGGRIPPPRCGQDSHHERHRLHGPRPPSWRGPEGLHGGHRRRRRQPPRQLQGDVRDRCHEVLGG